ATGGMLAAAASFAMLTFLPVDFSYPVFAAILAFNGISMGMFASPNRAAVMNSLPPGDRGAGGGMNQTFQNSAQVISMGIFFTLLIIGLSASLPHALASGLEAHGVAAAKAHQAGETPPISVLFAAFLGENPIEHLVGASTLHELPQHAQAVLTGHGFFPHLIAEPFANGLDTAFGFAIIACLIAAGASLMRGGRYTHVEPSEVEAPAAAPPIPELEESHAS
ncbi:MAG: MFS transporter, partial [Actinobacteria bacterium]|nr:MFS transporter [Actinomycetota bacterium]